MSMILAIAAFVLLLSLLFLIVLHPLMSLWDCVRSPNLSFFSRVLWALFTLVTGCIGSVLYGLFGTYSWSHRRRTVKCMLMCLLSIGAIGGVLYKSPELRYSIIMELTKQASELELDESSELQSTLATLIHTLEEESKGLLSDGEAGESFQSDDAIQGDDGLQAGQSIVGQARDAASVTELSEQATRAIESQLGQLSNENDSASSSTSGGAAKVVEKVVGTLGELREMIGNVKLSSGSGSSDQEKPSGVIVYPGDAPLRQNPFATGNK